MAGAALHPGRPEVDDLIALAARTLRPHTTPDGYELGDVASALLTDDGRTFVGVCIDTTCSTGFCAEHAAVAAMVTAGAYRIARIVAVGASSNDDGYRVMSPCGRCREFLRQIDPANLDTEVILAPDLVVRLRDLLPHHEWRES